jgi:hypothetical protein
MEIAAGGAVLVLVIVLVVTNLCTLALLVRWRLRPVDHPQPDDLVAKAIEAARPPTSTSSTRRVITVEILNPLELAGTRGRLAGIAGSFAPGITRRIVYDQAIRNLRQQLVAERVVADVRLHTIAPRAAATAKPGSAPVVDVVENAPPAETPLPEPKSAP